jgi:hypothetical protein
MQGDTFAAKKFIIEIPKTSFAKSNGRIKTGESASTPILIRFDRIRFRGHGCHARCPAKLANNESLPTVSWLRILM